MQPGQTVVELSADGVCHTSRCSDLLDPLTGFYQINATSVLCDVRCEAVGGGVSGVGLPGIPPSSGDVGAFVALLCEVGVGWIGIFMRGPASKKAGMGHLIKFSDAWHLPGSAGLWVCVTVFC